MTFTDIGIDINIVEALAKSGIKSPTPVQATSIGKILHGQNLIIKSNTGTGKTLAFLVPLINRIYLGQVDNQGAGNPDRKRGPVYCRQAR